MLQSLSAITDYYEDVMSEIDQQLTQILIDYDLSLQARRAQRTETSWPNESDLFEGTLQEIHNAMDGKYQTPEHWLY